MANRAAKIAASNPFANNLRRIADDILVGAPESVLAVREDGAVIEVGGFVLTPVGLEMRPGATFQEWENIGHTLNRVRRSYMWLVIDWLICGEHTWGSTYRETAERLGFHVETLRNYVSVGNRVEISRRRDELGIGHHDAVASMPPDKQIEWLGYAADNKLSVQELRDAIAGINRPVLPKGKDPLSRFQRAIFPFERRLPRVLRKADQAEKERMAEELRNLADRIERGDLG